MDFRCWSSLDLNILRSDVKKLIILLHSLLTGILLPWFCTFVVSCRDAITQIEDECTSLLNKEHGGWVVKERAAFSFEVFEACCAKSYWVSFCC